jgi:predicted transglutaminase-like cysteine proteinase
MNKGFKFIVGAVMVIASAAPAMAFGPGSLARNFGSDAKLEFVSASHRASAPAARITFCDENRDGCTARRSRWSRLEITMTEKHFRLLKSVNDKINHQIGPVNNELRIGDSDIWTLSPVSSVTEDYAITKRRELIAKGWPARTLRLAVAYTPYGESRMVLVAKTTSGDLVLDTRTDAIRRGNAYDLRWVTIQANGNATKSVAI